MKAFDRSNDIMLVPLPRDQDSAEEIDLHSCHFSVPAGLREPLTLLISCAPLLPVHLIESDIVAERVLFLL